MNDTPDDLDHGGPTVDHDTARQVVVDVSSSRHALAVLRNLLRGSGFDELDGGSGTGLAMLLEGAEQRLGLALDGLAPMLAALGVEDPPPTHYASA